MGPLPPTPTATLGPGNSAPVCQNCTTSTTPLWRRDESGAVLCNACGLFLKLHGTSRPISLKTDVIKSRNRVKTAGAPQKRKTLDGSSNGLPASRPEHYSYPNRTNVNAGPNGPGSPASRTQTPSGSHGSNIAPQHMFDGVALGNHSFQSQSAAISSLGLRHSSHSPTNERQLETPQSYDAAIQANTQLKTRVSELEVINELYRSTLSQYQQGQPPASQPEPKTQETDTQMDRLLEASRLRENSLKRRVAELEAEVAGLRGEQPPVKKQRADEYPEPPSEYGSSR